MLTPCLDPQLLARGLADREPRSMVRLTNNFSYRNLSDLRLVPALQIPEILLAIYQRCENTTLAQCCLVSRHWNLYAVDVLWKAVPLLALAETPFHYSPMVSIVRLRSF